MAGSPEWPADDVETLKRLWKNGRSAGQIAYAMSYSRNAVIGKVHRLKLEKRRSAVGGDGKVRRRPRRKPTMHTSNQVVTMAKKKEFRAAYVPPPAEAPTPTMVTLLDIEPHQCKWALDDGPVFHFCGAERWAGKPYCHHHYGRAYTPPQARVR